jgi:hypothetical protein
LIDWYGLAVSVFWIFGLAELLASFSIAHWLSAVQGKPMRQVLSEFSFRVSTATGIVLFAFGMLLGVDAWWEKGGWAVVIVLASWESITTWRAMRARG